MKYLFYALLTLNVSANTVSFTLDRVLLLPAEKKIQPATAAAGVSMEQPVIIEKVQSMSYNLPMISKVVHRLHVVQFYKHKPRYMPDGRIYFSDSVFVQRYVVDTDTIVLPVNLKVQ